MADNELSLHDAAVNLIDLENKGFSTTDWEEAMSDLRAAAETPDMPGLEELVGEGIEAMRLTREYVGEKMLPNIKGWSHFDWTEKAQAALDKRKWSSRTY